MAADSGALPNQALVLIGWPPLALAVVAEQRYVSDLRMYCPRCGDALLRRPQGELACERGEMALSQHLERGLTECFVQRSRTPHAAPLPFRVGGHWHCPGCGVPMAEIERGLVACPQCGLALGEFLRELLELHPHR